MAAVLAAAVLLTVTTLVATDNRIGRWVSNADVSRDRARRWDRLHWARVALLVVMWVVLVVTVSATP
jgi:ABC-type Fe3+ transport system permease subunit